MNRMTLVRLVFTVAAVAVAVGPAHGQGGPSVPRREETDPQWRRVVSREGAFAIQMPGEPQISQKDLRGKTGRMFRYTSYLVDLRTRAYMVSYSDYDRDTVIDLDEAVHGIIGDSPETRIISRRTVTLFERPGRFLDFIRDGHRMRYRLFAVGHRLYQIGMVALPAGFEDAEADFYMNSFWLVQ